MSFDLSKLEDWSSNSTGRNPTTWVAFEATTESHVVKAKRRKGARGRTTTAEVAALLESGGKNCRREQILRPEQIEALRLKREPKDLSVTCLGQEDGEGNVEYKYRIKDPHPVRLQQLITQMKYRLSEGNGECFYYIGIEDNGYPKGLEPAELEASIATLHRMATSLDAFVTLLHYLPAAWGRRAALLRVATSTAQEACHTDLRIAVAGSVDAGKSTLVAVLTHGSNGRPQLDNGRGLARMNVFRHKHEMQSGRTSSICHQLLGYDKDGRVINYLTPAATALTPVEITSCAAKVLTFLDMGGHEKYLKTALYGMTALLPDFGLLCVCAVAGLGRIAREHLAVAVALEVPVALIITKAELVSPERFAAVVAEVRQLVALTMRHESSPGAAQQQQRLVADTVPEDRRVEDASPLVTTEVEALASARILCQLHADSLASSTARGAMQVHMPIFAVSAVTGMGLPVLHTFLNALQPATPMTAASRTPLATGGSSGALLSSAASGASVSAGVDSSCDGTSSCGGTTSAGDSPRAAASAGELDNLDGPATAAAAAAAAASAGTQHQLLYAPPASTAAATAMAMSAAIPAEAQAVHFQVDGTFEVEGVGSVVSGTLVSGMVRVGQELLLGPTAAGGFTRVVVRQLQRSHVQVKQVRAGQTCTIAISPAVAPQPPAAISGSSTKTPFDGDLLPLGSSPGVGPMAAAAAASGGNGDRRISATGFEDALAAAQTALELCLAGGSDEDGGGGGADDDLFGFDASDGPTSPPARRVKVASPQPSRAAGSGPACLGCFVGEGIPISMSVCQLHSTTSFCAGGGDVSGVGGFSSNAAAATAVSSAAGLGFSTSTLSTSAPPPRTLSLAATPSPFSAVAPRSKGAVLLEPALQPRTSWTFEAVLILLGGHWPPRGLVSGRWPPAGDDEMDTALEEQQLQLDPRSTEAPAPELERSSSSTGPATSGRSGRMTPASGGIGDNGGGVVIGAEVTGEGGGRRGAALRVGALSDGGGGEGGSGGSNHGMDQPMAAMGDRNIRMTPPPLASGHSRTAASGGGGKPSGRRRRQRLGAASSYVAVVHCGSVRQPAHVLMMQELTDDGLADEPRPDGSSRPNCPDLRISASTRAAAALLHSFAPTMAPPGQLHPPATTMATTTTDSPGTPQTLATQQLHQQAQQQQQPALDHDLGCLVRVMFRWQHRPEWLREGAKLLVRDRGDGRVAGAGFVRRVLL